MALNEIIMPDSEFTDIVTLQYDTNKFWEIYLEEKKKGKISLSNSGSGLKTILLVLINIILMPMIAGKELGHYIFAFEELENNLHPALQRKLLLYIQKIAKSTGCCFILTTHSNIVIDMFSKEPDAQIIHVTHNGESASCKRVKTYIDNKGILDDLDVRASDLLQSNCIIWVEGPSDRLYFNKWVSLLTDGELREGPHYQCVYYGGRLLAHLTANENVDKESSGVEILKVNRNAIILMDSDKRSSEQKINTTKERIISEVESVGGVTWVTDGKEIENYIPTAALRKYFANDKLPELSMYEDIADYLNKAKMGEGDKYKNNKVLFAENICQFLTRELLGINAHLQEKVKEAAEKIKGWNKMR